MNDTNSAMELERALLRELTGEFAAFGFAPRLKQQEFIVKAPNCVWVAHIGFVRHKIDIDATLDIGVLLTSVEKLLKQAEWKGKGSATVGAEIGNLVDGRPRRWTIRTQEEAVDVAKQMATELARFGIGWLERFSNLETVFETLASNDRGSWLIMPLHIKRCAILVALANLLRCKEVVAVVADDCRSFLLNQREPQLSVFDEFIERLLRTP